MAGSQKLLQNQWLIQEVKKKLNKTEHRKDCRPHLLQLKASVHEIERELDQNGHSNNLYRSEITQIPCG